MRDAAGAWELGTAVTRTCTPSKPGLICSMISSVTRWHPLERLESVNVFCQPIFDPQRVLAPCCIQTALSVEIAQRPGTMGTGKKQRSASQLMGVVQSAPGINERRGRQPWG